MIATIEQRKTNSSILNSLENSVSEMPGEINEPIPREIELVGNQVTRVRDYFGSGRNFVESDYIAGCMVLDEETTEKVYNHLKS